MSVDQMRLKELIHYDPSTGKWTWLDGRNNAVCIGSEAGYVRKNKYRKIKIEGKVYSSSRLAFLYMTGKWPTKEVDHIDRNPSNDCWNNLREADRTQNNTNKGKYKTNSSGVKGIHWRKQSDKWHAQIQVDKKKIHLGLFDDIEDAIQARKQAEQEFLYV